MSPLQINFTLYPHLNGDVFKILQKHGEILRDWLELEHSSLIFHQAGKKNLICLHFFGEWDLADSFVAKNKRIFKD